MYSSVHGLKALCLTTSWWGVASDRGGFETLHFGIGFISAYAFTWCPCYGESYDSPFFFISFQQSIASPYWTNVLYIIWNCAWLSIDNDSHFIYSSIHGLKALYLTTNWWGVASDREDFEALHFLKSGFISAFAFTWCPWYGKPVQAVCRFFLYAFSIVLPY